MTLDRNNAPNLNRDNSTEAWAWAKIQVDEDCPKLNDSGLTNAGPSIADHRQLHHTSTRVSKASTKQCASLGEEQGWNSCIFTQFEPKFGVFQTQNDYQTLLLGPIWGYEGGSLNYNGTPPLLMTHLHTPYDAGPNLDSIMAHEASEIIKKKEGMRVSRVQESPLSTFDEALHD